MSSILAGPPRYRSTNPWPPPTAVAATVGILICATLLAVLLLQALGYGGGDDPVSPDSRNDVASLVIWLAVLQATVIALVVVAAGRYGARPADTLSLSGPPVCGAVLLTAIGMMLLVLLPYNIAVLAFAREALLEDLRPFVAPLRSDAGWLFALLIAVGAPVSEELLFRGFLLGALARTPIGYFGAALVSTLGWTALHLGYSGYGLVEVFIAGLFFSWVLWRTGNLWVPIVCHAVYNSAILVILLTLIE